MVALQACSSSASQNCTKSKIGPALNPKSPVCGNTLTPVSAVYPNHFNCLKSLKPSTINHLRSYNGGIELGSRRCIDFRNRATSFMPSCGTSVGEDDAYYMRRAVDNAREAIGCTSPNPMVGCVIVKDGKIVGEGFHPKAGQPHAEVFALRNARELAEGGTAYVSLEPCNHFGRTPPCTEALIKAKVAKVVVGMVDPNPIVASRGIERLRAAGIEVIVGVEEGLCKRLIEGFTHKMLTGKPFVTLRYSISANGMFLNRLGEGASACGGYYSKLLQENDAVIQSSSALEEFGFPVSMEPKVNQLRHVIISKSDGSSMGSLLKERHILMKRGSIIFAEEEGDVDVESAETGIENVTMDKISLEAVLDYCSNQGSCSVLLDVRGKVDGLGDILKDGFHGNLLQKIVVEVLPVWSGGEEGVACPLLCINQELELKNMTTTVSGGSVLLEGYF